MRQVYAWGPVRNVAEQGAILLAMRVLQNLGLEVRLCTLAVPNASPGYHTDRALLDVQMKVAGHGRRTCVKLRSADVRKLLGSANHLDPFKYRHCFVGRKEGQIL